CVVDDGRYRVGVDRSPLVQYRVGPISVIFALRGESRESPPKARRITISPDSIRIFGCGEVLSQVENQLVLSSRGGSQEQEGEEHHIPALNKHRGSPLKIFTAMNEGNLAQSDEPGPFLSRM